MNQRRQPETKEARDQRIADAIRKDPDVSNADLAARFGMSTSAIRKMKTALNEKLRAEETAK